MYMEFTLIFSLISCIIAIIGSILGIATFVLNRKDKAVKDAKATNTELINYRLDNIEENLKKILEKMDKNADENDIKIDKKMQEHIELYHKKG